MKRSSITALLCVLCGYVAFETVRLKQEVRQLQTNCAVAVFSAEAANRKVGAIAPFFATDKEAFIRAYLDANNLPLAVFPDETLNPIRDSLERGRNGAQARAVRETVFN
jgi:hypothetical protein